MAGGLVEAVQEAVDAGVLIATPTALRFGHGGIRHAAHEAVPAPLLLALHRQIGEMRIEQGDWEAAAYHLMQGVDSGDRVAAAGLERVAHEIRTSAPEWASELALRSLALTDSDDDARFARAATAVTNLVTAGRVGEADYLAHCALAAHGMTPWAAARFGWLSRSSTSSPAATRRRSRRSMGSCRVPRCRHRCGRRPSCTWSGRGWRSTTARGAATQVAEILSGGAGRDQTLPPALAALGLLTWRDGLAADALALLRSAVQRGDRQPDAAGGPFGRLCLAWMLTAIGDLEEATQVIDVARDEISARSETLWSPGPEFAAARVHLAAGRLDDAVAHARGAIDVAAAVGASSFVSRARAVLAEVALMRGELSEAAAHLESGRQSMAWPPWRMSTQRMVACEADRGRGRAREGAGRGCRPVRRRGGRCPDPARRSRRGPVARADRAGGGRSGTGRSRGCTGRASRSAERLDSGGRGRVPPCTRALRGRSRAAVDGRSDASNHRRGGRRVGGCRREPAGCRRQVGGEGAARTRGRRVRAARCGARRGAGALAPAGDRRAVAARTSGRAAGLGMGEPHRHRAGGGRTRRRADSRTPRSRNECSSPATPWTSTSARSSGSSASAPGWRWPASTWRATPARMATNHASV